jgi:eukaryotic-like serine/threonine-protein kinase
MTVTEFCALLTRSRLLPAATIRSLSQRWEFVARDPASVGDFASWLVDKGHLTAYQARLLGEGHPDNFFLGPYKILDRIGKGRMAGVYKAVNLDGQLVAVKVLPPSKAREPELLARFQREGRLAVQLNHPGIVRAFECEQHKNLHCLVMEYLEGQTLDELLAERGRLSAREAARLAFLTALGLQHLHEHGMVHRDLKSGNLMLVPAPARQENTLRSMVKILDIGLGRELFDPDSREVSADLTSEGTILGTPDYLSPEQARDPRRADIRSDLYSLGCILYQALAGEPPFKDDNLVRQILRHATQPPPALPREVPAGLGQVVMKLLAKDPGQRYQTPAETAEALKASLAAPAR